MKTVYQPDGSDYWWTEVSYGSCTVCDTLQQIQCMDYEDDYPTDEQVEHYWILCLHMIQRMKLLIIED